MSAIYFQSRSKPDGVEIRGPERAHMGLVLAAIGGVLVDAPQVPYVSPRALNACIKLRSDSLTLFARIHSQCESHGWIAGPDRQWIADTISEGLESGLFRQNMGWDVLQTFLRENFSEPVVMSFSGCERFPNAHVAKWNDEYEGKPWDELSEDFQWTAAMELLYGEADSEQHNENAPFSRQLRPSLWNTYFFAE